MRSRFVSYTVLRIECKSDKFQTSAIACFQTFALHCTSKKDKDCWRLIKTAASSMAQPNSFPLRQAVRAVPSFVAAFLAPVPKRQVVKKLVYSDAIATSSSITKRKAIPVQSNCFLLLRAAHRAGPLRQQYSCHVSISRKRWQGKEKKANAKHLKEKGKNTESRGFMRVDTRGARRRYCLKWKWLGVTVACV